jgi:hypothetical protein
MIKNLRKKLQLKFLYISLFDQKMQFTYLSASIKEVQAIGEAFSLKREHPAVQTIKFSNFFKFLCVIFALLPNTAN